MKLSAIQKVLAADPGYGRLGLAVLERAPVGAAGGTRERVLLSVCVETEKSLSLPERIALLEKEVSSLLETYAPDAVAFEKIFFNQNTSTALGVAEVRGMLQTLAGQRGLPVFQYSPQDVKIAVTGYGKAEKKAVAAMVERLVVLEKRPRLDDEMDAIAIGIACLASTRSL
jgi:crossover junction endodeoxyribonuclease RuvC